MFGAISRVITCVPRAPDRRARPTNSREASENVWARIARAAHGQEVSPIRTASTTRPSDAQVGGDDDQDRERRDHEHDVREHAEDLVDDAAAVAADESDRHRDDRGDRAGERADDEARAEPVDELGEDVLARGGRPEPVLPRRRLADAVAELERVGVGEPRPDDRQTRKKSTTASPITSFRFRSAK